MTNEEKQLLLNDLCGRLPYEVKVDHFGVTRDLLGVIPSSFPCASVMVGYDINDYEDSVIEDIKPYLRPMSSMTDGEREEWADKFNFAMDELSSILDEKEAEDAAPYMFAKSHFTSIDWLLAHHFDFRGLIEKGLALEAPKGMYK